MKSNKKNKSIGADFTEGRIAPMFLLFIIPFLLSNLLNSLYNTVDTIIIGQYVGSSGIVAVTIGGKVLNLLTFVSQAFGGGGQVLIAQLIGARKRKEVGSAIGTLFTLMLVLSLILGVFFFFASGVALHLLNTSEEVYADAYAYMRITCMGLPFIFGYNAVSAILRGMGDSRHPLLFVAIAAVFNLAGDLVLIAGFGMGAAGAAIATVLGQATSLIFSIGLLYKNRDKFGFDFKLRSFGIDLDKLRIIFRLGIPVALRVACINLTQLYLFRYLNLFPVADVAAYSVSDKIYHLTNIFSTAAKHAGGSMAAQNIGAEKYDRAKIIMRDTFVFLLIASAILTVPGLLAPTVLFRLFSSESDVLVYAPVMMKICCLIYFLSSIATGYETIITGTGASELTLLGGFLDGVVLRIGFCFLFAFKLKMGVPGFFLADTLARMAPLLVGMIYYHSGAWLRRKRLIDN